MTTMGEVGNTLQKYLDDDPGTQEIMRKLQLDLPVLIWADDIAILVAEENSQQLEQKIASTMTMMKPLLEERGLKTNFKKGKTEMVLTPAGDGAKKVRQK